MSAVPAVIHRRYNQLKQYPLFLSWTRARQRVLSPDSFMEQQPPSENSLIEQRKTNLAKLSAKGINPFANKFTPTLGCGEARAKYVAGELKEGGHIEIAGRITAHRDMGKSQFMDLKDVSGRIQIYAQKQTLGDEQFDIFKHLDLGDFIGVKGELFTTKAGEPSVKITSFVILAKALRPPPAKWHGLEDTEIRYRQRYLDLMANDEVKDVFLKRAAIVREMRNFMHSRGYVEVETPMMQSIPGGAAAQPFITKHNALGCQLYLRIALELYHKRLLVGGIDRVFEIGRIFRNEGLSRRHNPEFTMMEAYEAYGDYETMMELLESMIKHLAQSVLGTLKVPRKQSGAIALALDNALKALDEFSPTNSSANVAQAIQQSRTHVVELKNALGIKPEKEVANEAAKALVQYIAQNMEPDVLGESAEETLKRFKQRAEPWMKEYIRIIIFPWFELSLAARNSEIDLNKWTRAKYKDLVRQRVSGKTNGKVSDWFALSAQERRSVAIEDLKLEGDIAAGYEDFEVTGAVFEKLIEPTLIQPTFVTHLPKELVPLAKLSPDDPTTVEVFELCINGQEIAPGYTEQNNPIEQRERLEHQAGGEQQKLDEDFLVALEHGMPPAGGIGIGIDRLCMMLLGQESIRDVILFPQLKPK
jgi:lysyl-tRNA synthetase